MTHTRVSKSRKRKIATRKMVNTKKQLQRLRDAQKAYTIIANGGSLEDIFREFNCTTIAQALQHVRNAIRLGGAVFRDVAGGVLSLFRQTPSIIERNVGQGGTLQAMSPEERFRRLGQHGGLRDELIAFATPIARELDIALRAGGQLADIGARQFFGIETNDPIERRIEKIITKLYGPPAPRRQ